MATGDVLRVDKHIIGIVTLVDDNLFGKKTLSNRLFRSYVLMALLTIIIPVASGYLYTIFQLPLYVYSLMMSILVFLVLLLFIHSVITKLVSPIYELGGTLRKIQAGNLNVELNLAGYQEMDRLVKATDRLRNSLMIAKEYLGERESTLDKNLMDKIMDRDATLKVFISYLAYGILFMSLSGIMYSSEIISFFSPFPQAWLIPPLLVILSGTFLALVFGMYLTNSLGTPLHQMADTAEKISVGKYDATFPRGLKGELAELSQHFISLKNAMMVAEKEMLQAMGLDGSEENDPLENDSVDHGTGVESLVEPKIEGDASE